MDGVSHVISAPRTPSLCGIPLDASGCRAPQFDADRERQQASVLDASFRASDLSRPPRTQRKISVDPCMRGSVCATRSMEENS
jgi:hypothetical protein